MQLCGSFPGQRFHITWHTYRNLREEGPIEESVFFLADGLNWHFFLFHVTIWSYCQVVTVIEALNKLKLAGLPDKQAEAILEAFEERDRSWFESHFERLRTEMEKMRRELQAEMEKMRRELQAEIEKGTEIKDAKFEMIRWIVGTRNQPALCGTRPR